MMTRPRRSDPKAEPPAEVDGEEPGVEQDERRERAGRRADPVAAVDRQVDPPRTLAGISSSIAELIAEYSPPIPAPVKKRKRAKLQKSQANPVQSAATRYKPRVTVNSFFRPSLSVR